MRLLFTLLFCATLCCSNAVAMAAPRNTKSAKRATIATAPSQVTLPAQSLKPLNINIVASEATDIILSDAWFGIVGGCGSIAAKEEQTLAVWAEPNLSNVERRGEIKIVSKKRGKSQSITVVQPPYLVETIDAFPARFAARSYTADRWASDGICTSKEGGAMFTAVSTSGNSLLCEDKQGATISNLGVGDYLLFAVPVKAIAAGEQIDFMCTIGASEANAPKYWIFEYWDGGRWNTIENELRVAEENPAIRYSFYIKHFESQHHTTYTQSFTLNTPIAEGVVKVRLRVLSEGKGRVRIPNSRGYEGIWMVRYKEAPAVSDINKILMVGNSFTYFYGVPFMLKEIARSEGHQIDAIVSVKGGQEFEEHLKLERTLEAIARGGFDYAFLQDTSPNPAIYADKEPEYILNESRKINDLTLRHSPCCKIIYERTWACPYNNYRTYGSYERLECLLERGSKMIAERLGNVAVSPIGIGFRVAREKNISLLDTDNRHQSSAGAYMKACINYLFIYRTRFSENVSDCGIESNLAKEIRAIAEQIVLCK